MVYLLVNVAQISFNMARRVCKTLHSLLFCFLVMRFTFAGHSLGGAVAALSTLRLLATHAEASSFVSCITFACVALGNQDVSRTVQANGWSHMFHNFILPGATLVSGVPRCNKTLLWWSS